MDKGMSERVGGKRGKEGRGRVSDVGLALLLAAADAKKELFEPESK